MIHDISCSRRSIPERPLPIHDVTVLVARFTRVECGHRPSLGDVRAHCELRVGSVIHHLDTVRRASDGPARIGHRELHRVRPFVDECVINRGSGVGAPIAEVPRVGDDRPVWAVRSAPVKLHGKWGITKLWICCKPCMRAAEQEAPPEHQHGSDQHRCQGYSRDNSSIDPHLPPLVPSSRSSCCLASQHHLFPCRPHRPSLTRTPL